MKKNLRRVAIAALMVATILLATVNVSYASNLTDIAGHKNQTAIEHLEEIGAVQGNPDGTFKPDTEINRAEILKILFEISGDTLVEPTEGCFPDVPAGEWFSKYVCTGQNLGHLSGYPDNTFRPGNSINKVEALKLIAEFLDWNLDSAADEPLFNDTEPDAWYAKYLRYAKKNGLLEETGPNFNPGANILRGSVAEIIYRSLVGLDTVTITSSDGKASLKIPKDALPDTTFPYFGVIHLILNDTFQTELGVPVNYGALVKGPGESNPILPGGYAENAGVQDGDIILKVEEFEVNELNPLSRLFSQYKAGDEVSITVMRNGEEMTLTGEVAEKQLEMGDINIIPEPVKSVDGTQVYRMEPDGLQFSEDLTASITADFADGTIPFLFNQSSDFTETELITETDVVIDLVANETTVSGPISHFSDLVLTHNSIGELEVEPGVVRSYVRSKYQAEDFKPLEVEVSNSDVKVTDTIFTNVSFKANYDVFSRDAFTFFSDEGVPIKTTFSERSIKEDSINLEGRISAKAAPSAFPQQTIEDRPPTTNMTGNNAELFIEDHFCEEPHDGNRMEYEAVLTMLVKHSLWSVDEMSQITEQPTFDSTLNSNVKVLGNPFDCVDEGQVDFPVVTVYYEHFDGFSVIYLDIPPTLLATFHGVYAQFTLTGPGVAGDPIKTFLRETDGSGHTEWEINAYGVYNITGTLSTAGGEEVDITIIVTD